MNVIRDCYLLVFVFLTTLQTGTVVSRPVAVSLPPVSDVCCQDRLSLFFTSAPVRRSEEGGYVSGSVDFYQLQYTKNYERILMKFRVRVDEIVRCWRCLAGKPVQCGHVAGVSET